MQTKWGVHKDHLLTSADKYSSAGLTYSGANKGHPPAPTLPYFWLDSTDVNTIRVNGETQYGKGLVESAQVINWLQKGSVNLGTTNITPTSDITVSYYCGVPMIRWIWSGTTRAFGATASLTAFNFLHLAGGEYSIYVVFKNNIVEPATSRCILFATKNNTSTNRGMRFAMGNSINIGGSGDYGKAEIMVSNGTTNVFGGGPQGWQRLNGEELYQRDTDDSPKVYSFLQTNLGQTLPNGIFYKNGKAQRSITPTNTGLFSTTGNAVNNFTVGYAVDVNTGLDGYLGQLLIYNQRHDIATHNNIVQWLKEKYNV